MFTTSDWISAVASIVAIVSLLFSVYVYRRQQELIKISYLILALELERNNDFLIAKTSLENRSTPAQKQLMSVLLLVSPLADDPIEAFNAVVTASGQAPVRYLRDFPRSIPDDTESWQNDRGLVVLNGYYRSENTGVGDEILTYDAVVDISHLNRGRPYAVRLVLHGKHGDDDDRNLRVVQRAFVA